MGKNKQWFVDGEKKRLNLDQKINDSKHLNWSCLSINFRWPGRFPKPTKTSNKYHSFYNTVLLKKLHSTNLTSVNIIKNILPQSSQKPY